jgi:hypothetical protein
MRSLVKAEDGVKRILDTEASNARNMGSLDGIIKVNAFSGIEDPIVYFVVVRDNDSLRRVQAPPPTRRREDAPSAGTCRSWATATTRKGE